LLSQSFIKKKISGGKLECLFILEETAFHFGATFENLWREQFGDLFADAGLETSLK
jgi:hypothetical protein